MSPLDHQTEPPGVTPASDWSGDLFDESAQINVPPARPGALWKVVCSAVRCPLCGSRESKARTGKRVKADGLTEHYRQCVACEGRFKVVLE